MDHVTLLLSFDVAVFSFFFWFPGMFVLVLILCFYLYCLVSVLYTLYISVLELFFSSIFGFSNVVD